MPNQWIRKAQLIVKGASSGLDLSQMEFRFQVKASDIETPNTLACRVYNLADSTVKQIKGEFTQVTLEAGYQNGNFGLIFSGNIKQLRKGKETDVDTYLDILAADGDIASNFGVINMTLPSGTTQAQVFTQLAKSLSGQGVNTASDAQALANANAIKNVLSRGKVMLGMTRDYLRDWANTNGFRYSIQNGQLTLVPVTGYRDGTIVQINSQTGMIGQPEVTDGGIIVRCLLNPLIRIGALVQINNADINQTWVKDAVGLGSFTNIASVLRTSEDGFYRVMVAEFEGDTRGQAWDSVLTCLAKDSLPQQKQ